MTTFEEMLKQRPVDPKRLEEKVQKMYEETQETLYAEKTPELNQEGRAPRVSRRKRISDLRAEE